MATDTAVAEAKSSRSAPDPTSHVWQVPLFLAAAAMFVAVWQGWLPLGTPDPAGEFERDVAALATAAERVSVEREELKGLLAKVAAAGDRFPAQAPRVHFALGSGYVRLAELTGELAEARTYWLHAKEQLERVRSEELGDPGEAPKLAFRAAKARAAVGLAANAPAADVRSLITVLGIVPFGEEAGEAGRLQAALALRLDPPDIQTARSGLERYLRSSGASTPAVSLARARLLLGEIYERSRQPELAKTWLEQIGIDAPTDVLAPAKILIARLRMKEDDWLGAARELESVRALPSVPAQLRVASAYLLGVCKVSTREPETAAKLLEEAAKGEGLEARAAAVRLAELYLKTADPARHMLAPDLLARALRGAADLKELRVHEDLRADALRPVFELAVGVLVRDGAFEPAMKTIDVYATLAAPGREREQRAEVLAAWAAALQKANGEFKPKAALAAAEYEAVAGLQPAATAKADVFRRAAAMYRLADDPAKAVDTLQKVLQLPQLPDAVTAPVWADLADALIAAKRPDEVWAAYNQIMATATPVSTAIRYQLAAQFAKNPRPEFAALGRQLYEQIAKMEVGPEEQGFHELALSELAHDLIKANNFAEAEVWARKQIGTYPTGPEAGLGRLFLGICLLQRAAATPVAGADPMRSSANADRLREEALALFKQIITDVEGKLAGEKKLADRDVWLRLQAGLRILQTYQQMNRPNDLLADAAPLLERHRGTVEELIIWSLVYHAFRQKGETGKALQTRDQMRELFDRLPPTAFRAAEGEYSRGYWEKVWFAPDPKSK